MATEDAFFLALPSDDGAGERFRATRHTAGPWTDQAQHASPPAALMGRASEGLIPDGMTVSRFAMDLLGAVPVGDLRVSAAVARSGRVVSQFRAELVDEATGRVVAQASAWCVPELAHGPVAGARPVPPGPETGRALDLPPGWVPGYADAIDWRWVAGHIAEPGPGTAWMRPRVPLVAGEELTPLQRVLACVDSASGISAVLDILEWDFRNLALTVHLTRPVVGEWVAVEAETLISGAGSGVARSTLYDASGLLGISAQALLIRPRSA